MMEELVPGGSVGPTLRRPGMTQACGPENSDNRKDLVLHVIEIKLRSTANPASVYNRGFLCHKFPSECSPSLRSPFAKKFMSGALPPIHFWAGGETGFKRRTRPTKTGKPTPQYVDSNLTAFDSGFL